jgi:neuronal cell adhesion molecule
LFLYWTRPDEPNGNLIGYRIFYEEVHGTQLIAKLERQPQIRDPLMTGAKLAGLKPATKYRITIHAETKMGMGDPYYIELETSVENNAGKNEMQKISPNGIKVRAFFKVT